MVSRKEVKIKKGCIVSNEDRETFHVRAPNSLLDFFTFMSLGRGKVSLSDEYFVYDCKGVVTLSSVHVLKNGENI